MAEGCQLHAYIQLLPHVLHVFFTNAATTLLALAPMQWHMKRQNNKCTSAAPHLEDSHEAFPRTHTQCRLQRS